VKRSPKKITVHWLDHHEMGGEFDPLEAGSASPVMWESRGYLASENTETIQVSRDTCRNPDFDPYGATVTIMKNCIVYRSDVKKPRPVEV